uniref:Uncharacterized protein n=1 Tax=Anguilla anguilla TaxID=7936 RepID=A0A0E9QNU2_ANGAN
MMVHPHPHATRHSRALGQKRFVVLTSSSIASKIKVKQKMMK